MRLHNTNFTYTYNETDKKDLQKIEQKDLDYSYPDDLDLKPGTDLHSKILGEVLERAYISSGSMSQRYDAWARVDESLTGYKPQSEEDKRVKSKDSTKPVSIVFPYSYAIEETLIAYSIAAFFRDPIFSYEGYSPEDVIGSILLEKIVNLHCIKNKTILALHTMHKDSYRYGMGIVHPYWKYQKKFSGNALMNIDPYTYLPDINVPIHALQEGEYVGWHNDTNYMSLLSEEYENKDLFNVKYLSEISNRGTNIFTADNSGRNIKTGMPSKEFRDTNTITEIRMYIKLIPKEWELSESERPEVWFFRIASDKVVLTAREAGFEDNKFPVAIAVPDFDGYSNAPIGRIEMLQGMQETVDFFYNSRVANVRKAVNNVFIVDPKIIDVNKFKDLKHGGIAVGKRDWWGKGALKDGVHQLQIDDVTKTHIMDVDYLTKNMQILMGTDNPAMGVLRSGGPERLTKAEFQGTAGGQISRLERTARIVGVQAYQDIGEFFGYNVKTLMDDDMYIKVTGKWEDVLREEYGVNEIIKNRNRMKVSPKDLDINYDVVVRDGTVPGGNYSEVWIRLFDILSKQPQLANQFDIVRIFKHIARNEGAKNVEEFVRKNTPIKASAMPDEELQQQVAAGNLTPVGV
jgi:hypothetical protein